MPQYDAGRQADIRMLSNRLNDPSLTAQQKKKVETALYAVRAQADSKAIAKMREQMKAAVINGDKARIEQINKEAKRIDTDWF